MIEAGDLVRIKESGIIGQVLRVSTIKMVYGNNDGIRHLISREGDCGYVEVASTDSKNRMKLGIPFYEDKELALICKAKDRQDKLTPFEIDGIINWVRQVLDGHVEYSVHLAPPNLMWRTT